MPWIVGLLSGLLLFITIKTNTEKIHENQAGDIIPAKGVSLDDIYKYHANQKGLDWRLIKAIARVESSENPQAKNPSDPSFGLMQILCKPDGNGSCSNTLYVNDWPPENKTDLYDPDYNCHIGSQILAWNIDNYGFNKGIAVYNSWAAHETLTGENFPNQGYVDKVLEAYAKIKQVYNERGEYRV